MESPPPSALPSSPSALSKTGVVAEGAKRSSTRQRLPSLGNERFKAGIVFEELKIWIPINLPRFCEIDSVREGFLQDFDRLPRSSSASRSSCKVEIRPTRHRISRSERAAGKDQRFTLELFGLLVSLLVHQNSSKYVSAKNRCEASWMLSAGCFRTMDPAFKLERLLNQLRGLF